jgi:hypothetical protein
MMRAIVQTTKIWRATLRDWTSRTVLQLSVLVNNHTPPSLSEHPLPARRPHPQEVWTAGSMSLARPAKICLAPAASQATHVPIRTAAVRRRAWSAWSDPRTCSCCRARTQSSAARACSSPSAAGIGTIPMAIVSRPPYPHSFPSFACLQEVWDDDGGWGVGRSFAAAWALRCCLARGHEKITSGTDLG